MSDEAVPKPRDEWAIYDSVPHALPPRRGGGHSATAIPRPKNAIKVALIAVLLACSLAVLAAGIALFARSSTAEPMAVLIIVLGGCLLAWHLRLAIASAGRRNPTVNPWSGIGLAQAAAFGLVGGFAGADMISGIFGLPRIALLSAGIGGLVAGIVTFVRDQGLDEQRAGQPIATPQIIEPEAVPATAPPLVPVGADELRPRGVWPLPKRGSPADASLWDEVQFEEDEPPRPARRAQ